MKKGKQMNFKQIQLEKINEIEDVLKRNLPPTEGFQSLVMEAMDYSVMGGGKRLRPMLMIETFKMFGGTSEIIEKFATALEMIHTYSLVHDDLPAMDNDDYRRGRKTTHIVYGHDMGILTGDALLNYAFEVAFQSFSKEPAQALEIGKALQILGKKAGIYGMIGGQVVDVKSSGTQLSKDELLFIFNLKTAALIEAAMMIGGVLAGASDKEIAIIEKIANNVGVAFQIQDDILDVTSTMEELGKPIGSDEKNEKTTYITLEGLDKSTTEVERLSNEAIQLLVSLEKPSEYMEELIKSMIHRKK